MELDPEVLCKEFWPLVPMPGLAEQILPEFSIRDPYSKCWGLTSGVMLCLRKCSVCKKILNYLHEILEGRTGRTYVHFHAKD